MQYSTKEADFILKYLGVKNKLGRLLTKDGNI